MYSRLLCPIFKNIYLLLKGLSYNSVSLKSSSRVMFAAYFSACLFIVKLIFCCVVTGKEYMDLLKAA